MILRNIKNKCLERGIKSGYQLHLAAHPISPTVAQALFNETYTRLSLRTLDKLCTALNCQPGDLLQFVPEKKGKK